MPEFEPKEDEMSGCREATLAELMADPVILTVMRADGIDPQDFESSLRAIARDREDQDSASAEAEPV